MTAEHIEAKIAHRAKEATKKQVDLALSICAESLPSTGLDVAFPAVLAAVVANWNLIANK